MAGEHVEPLVVFGAQRERDHAQDGDASALRVGRSARVASRLAASSAKRADVRRSSAVARKSAAAQSACPAALLEQLVLLEAQAHARVEIAEVRVDAAAARS